MRIRPVIVLGALLVSVLTDSSSRAVAAPGDVGRASVSSAGAQGDGQSGSFSGALEVLDLTRQAAVSGDGRFVAFASAATNLVAGDTNGHVDVFVRDRVAGTTERVSVSGAGAQGDDISWEPDISADGRFVVFTSRADNLAGGRDNDVGEHVYVRDRTGGTTTLVSALPAGADALLNNSGGRSPSISPDGQFVVYISNAVHVHYGAGSGSFLVLRWDRLSGEIAHVGLTDGEGVPADSQVVTDAVVSSFPDVSSGGQRIVFESTADNLVAGDTNGVRDVFVRDMAAGTTVRVNLTDAGAQGDASAEWASIDDAGTRVAFQTAASLDPFDTNGRRDVYVRDLATGDSILAAATPAGGSSPTAGRTSGFGQISGDGTRVAFWSNQFELHPDVTSGGEQLYVRDLVQRRTVVASRSAGGDPASSHLAFDSRPALDADGSIVAYGSFATDVVPGDTNGTSDVFVTEPDYRGETGYWMLDESGTIYEFGDSDRFDAVGAPVAAFDATTDGSGLWVLTQGGRVVTRGDAQGFGDVPSGLLVAGERPTTIAGRPDGSGYWVFTDRGRAVGFGSAEHFGDMSAVPLNGPVVGSAVTPSGQGYWMVASDGGIFSFGDAQFYGSMGSVPLTRPVNGIAPDPDGRGYWLVASDGGIFAFDGDFRGSMGATPLSRPVIGAIAFGNGYLMVASDGGIFNFSDQPFLGSLGANPPASPIVGVAAFTR